MNITIDEPAKKVLRRMEKELRKKIGQEINKYQTRQPVNIKKLKARENEWRISVDDWRIFLKVDAESQIIHITAIVQRKDAYR